MRTVSYVAACVFLTAVTVVLGWGDELVYKTDRPCDLMNLSQSLDEFKQHWRVKCVGVREFADELWSVEGRLVCTALQSIFFPFPTPPLVLGVHRR